MTARVIAAARSAYPYQPLIRRLWHAALLQAADQEVVYRDLRRFTYRELKGRVGRRASAPAGISSSSTEEDSAVSHVIWFGLMFRD